MTRTIIAVALESAGRHPAAWREPDARPAELFGLGYWADLVRLAESGDVDVVTFEDALGLQSDDPFAPDDRVDRVRGRLDAQLVADAVAPLTTRIGLVPTVTTTHTEPFHVATGVQTLDFVSHGRAGWQARVSAGDADAAAFGRRTLPADFAERTRELFEEASEVVEVVRRLQTSWGEDAIIRDAASGRFLDRERIRGAGFAGRHVSVAGASITPRSPQAIPPVFALAHARVPYEFAATSADVVFVAPHGADDDARVIAEVRDAERRVGRTGEPLRVLADLEVLLEETPGLAARELARLDGLAGAPFTSDAEVFAGAVADLRARIDALVAAGYDGVRLRPARLPHDLESIVDGLMPTLPRRDASITLRERLGLPAVPAGAHRTEEVPA